MPSQSSSSAPSVDDATSQLLTDAAAVGVVSDEDAAQHQTNLITRMKENSRDWGDKLITMGMRSNLFFASKPWFSKPMEALNRTVETGQALVVPAVAAMLGRNRLASGESVVPSLDTWAHAVLDAMKGKIEITGHDQTELYYGHALSETLHSIPLYGAGPMGDLISPIAALDKRVRRLMDLPERQLTVGDMMDVLYDNIIDPTLLIPGIPEATGLKYTKLIAGTRTAQALGKPFKAIGHSRLMGQVNGLFIEPLNALRGTGIGEEAVNRMLDAETKLVDNDVPRLKSWIKGTSGSAPVAQQTFPNTYRTGKDLAHSAANGAIPANINATLNFVNLGRHMVGEVGARTKIPGIMEDFVAGGRRFVVQKGAPVAKLAGEFDAIFSESPSLARMIKLRQAMGWPEADINSWIMRQGKYSLREVNQAWGKASGMVGKTTNKLSKITAPVAALSHGSIMDQHVYEWLTGQRSLKAFTPGEQAWLKNLGLIVGDLRQSVGLSRSGLMKDMGGMMGDGKFVPADVVANVSNRTIRDIKLPKGKRPIGGAQGSAIDLIQDFAWLARRKEAMDPFVQRYTSKPIRQGVGAARRWAEGNTLLTGLPPSQRVMVGRLVDQITGQAAKPGQIHRALDYTFGYVGHMMNENLDKGLFARTANILNKVHPGFGAFIEGRRPFPEVNAVQKYAFAVQHHMIRATLGGRLDAAIANTFITVNTVMRKGLPDTVRGALSVFNPLHQNLIKESGLMRAWKGVFEEGLLHKGIYEHLDNGLFTAFNMGEYWGKAVAFNTAAEKFARDSGARSLGDFLIHATPKEKTSLLHYSRMEAIYETHLYGSLGRPPLTNNPFIRPFTTLLSFAPKQVGVLNRVLHEDPSGLLRFWALSSVIVNRMDNWFGADASSWVGLGFLPMTKNLGGIPIVASPEASMALDLLTGLGMAGDGDYKGAQGPLERVMQDLPGLAAGIPTHAIRDYVGAWDEWRDSSRPTSNGGAIQSSKAEAAARLFFPQSTLDAEQRHFALKSQAAQEIVAHELDIRIEHWRRTTKMDPNSDAVLDADARLNEPVMVNGQQIPITKDMIADRMRNAVKRQELSADELRWLNYPGWIKFMYNDDHEKIEAMKARRGVRTGY
jgi:hypothetical protein